MLAFTQDNAAKYADQMIAALQAMTPAQVRAYWQETYGFASRESKAKMVASLKAAIDRMAVSHAQCRF